MLLAHRARWRSSLVSGAREFPAVDVARTLERRHVLLQAHDFGASLAVAVPRATATPISAMDLRGTRDKLMAHERRLAELLHSETLAPDVDAG